MSVNAYPIKILEYEEEPLFNLWRDSYFMRLLVVTGILGDTSEQPMMLDIDRITLDEMKDIISEDKKNKTAVKEDIERGEEIVGEIQNIMLRKKEDYVSFYCF